MTPITRWSGVQRVKRVIAVRIAIAAFRTGETEFFEESGFGNVGDDLFLK